MFSFRLYQPGNEEAIIKLFQVVFGKPMSLDFWRWRFLEHPAGAPQILLAFDGDVLAGHYAVSHAPLALSGNVIPACLSMTTMTHPDYRGRGLFEKTANALYEHLQQDGIGAVYGFPNSNSHPLFVSKLGWQDIYELPTLTLDLTQLTRLPPKDPAIVELPEIDIRFTRFWEAISPTMPVAGSRDRDLLTWRIDRNPENVYTRLVLLEGDEIAGYAITKPFGADATDLVELRAADKVGAKALLTAALSRAIMEGRFRMATWCLPHELHRPVLEYQGFKASGPVTYFGGRSFSPLPSDLSDGRLWRLSMLDSDLY